MFYLRNYRHTFVNSSILSILVFCSPVASAMEFSLFGDASFHSSDDSNESETFRIGQIDLIANQEISPKSSVEVEIVFEDGGEHGGYEVDVERFAVVRQLSEDTQIGLGRFHTPLGIWNANYHHGSLIQDTVSRPFFLNFEDSHTGILPVHLIGLKFSGAIKSINYQLMMGNSNGINSRNEPMSPAGNELVVFNNSDLNNDKSYIARTAMSLLKGKLEIGLNLMNNSVVETGVADTDPNVAPLTAQGNVLFDQEITGVDLHWFTSNSYVLAELYQIKNTDNQQLIRNTANISNGSYNALATYVQLGYHMSDELTLAFRYETLDFDPGNTYMEELGIDPQTNYVAAISYQLEESNAVRFEFNQSNVDNLTQDSYTSYTIQWYFLLF